MSWYCKLCNFWMGDLHCASAHLKSQTHSNKYNVRTKIFFVNILKVFYNVKPIGLFGKKSSFRSGLVSTKTAGVK